MGRLLLRVPVHGICVYYNEIPQQSIKDLVAFLQSKFGGEIIYEKSRIFLRGSKEFADPKSIGMLANELSLEFKAPVELTIEFEKVTQEEKEQNIASLCLQKRHCLLWDQTKEP